MRNNQKGFANILIIVVVIAVLAVAGYFVLNNKSENNNPTAQQTQNLNTPTPTQTSNEVANWQVYKDQKFQLSIPPQWHKNPRGPGQLILADNSPYYLIFSTINLDQYEGDATTKSLYSSGKLLEAEQAITKSMCGETGSCGKITESKSISVSGGTGVEFIVQYKGLRIDEPRGFLNEIHRTILKNGVIYRFWTSEQVAPVELKKEYPKLDPSPIELFRKILDTFKVL